MLSPKGQPFCLGRIVLMNFIMKWNASKHAIKPSVKATVYPKKYAHGFCFAVLCCGYTLTDFPISIRLTSLALWQSNDCPSASKATLMNMDKYFMWIHYEQLHNHNKAKHNKTVCIFLGIYCKLVGKTGHLALRYVWRWWMHKPHASFTHYQSVYTDAWHTKLWLTGCQWPLLLRS